MVARFQDRVRGGGSYVQVRASVDRATAYRIPVLFPHNNVIDNGAGDEIRGFMSELGLAQSEDSFQLSSTTKLKTKKRTVTSRVDCLLETVFQSHGRSECSGRREKTLTWAVCDKGLRDVLLRGPKTLYCATESHRKVSSGRFLGSPEARFE